MKMIDNVTTTVRDDLQQTIHKGSKLSIAAAYFSIYAYYHRNTITSIWNTRLQKITFPAVIQYIYDHYNTVTLLSLAEHFGKSEGNKHGLTGCEAFKVAWMVPECPRSNTNF